MIPANSKPSTQPERIPALVLLVLLAGRYLRNRKLAGAANVTVHVSPLGVNRAEMRNPSSGCEITLGAARPSQIGSATQ